VFCVAAIKTADTAAQKFALDTLVRLQSEINTRLYDPNVQIEQFRADCHAIFAQALAVRSFLRPNSPRVSSVIATYFWLYGHLVSFVPFRSVRVLLVRRNCPDIFRYFGTGGVVPTSLSPSPC
jgi:hypothetical protein